VEFDVKAQLLIRYSVFVRYWQTQWEYSETVKVKVKLFLYLTKHHAMKL
jgi:hypothetical protein